MKILLICPEFPPKNIGGGGIVYKNLAKELMAKGHKVRVIAGNFHNTRLFGQIEKIFDNKALVYFLPLVSPPTTKDFDAATYTPPTIIGLFFLLKQLIKSKNEVVHLHGLFHPFIDIAAFACMLTRKKYVLTCHGIPISPKKAGLIWKTIFQIYLYFVERIVVRSAAIFTGVSNSILEECNTKGLINRHTSLIYNGINSEFNKTKSISITKLEKKYSLTGKQVIFGLGRLNHSKGFQYLIGAMNEVSLRLPEAVAVIAGIGPYQKTLEKLITRKGLLNQVKLVGYINEEEKIAFYKRSEVVVFPSLQEPFGLVILESFSMHKPVVAFDTKTSRELIDNNFNGLLASLGDEKKLSASIIRILTDTALRDNLVKNTFFTNRSFRWEQIIKKYIRTYQQVLE